MVVRRLALVIWSWRRRRRRSRAAIETVSGRVGGAAHQHDTKEEATSLS
jgi:hypothetical protein